MDGLHNSSPRGLGEEAEGAQSQVKASLDLTCQRVRKGTAGPHSALVLSNKSITPSPPPCSDTPRVVEMFASYDPDEPLLQL